MYEDTKMILEAAEAKRIKEKRKADKDRLMAVAEGAYMNEIWNKLASRNDDAVDFLDFKQKVTDAYVVEALTIFVDNCLSPELIREEYHQKLVRQLVTEFVKEEDSLRLLRKFKSTSYVMSEIAYAIETTVQSVIENAKKDDTVKLEKEDKKKFYEKLENVDVEEAVDKITSRVKEQTADFINNNMKVKAELASALTKTENKVSEVKNKLEEKVNSQKAQEKAAKLEEAYIEQGKRQMADIRSSSTKNVFEAMVYTLSQSAMVNESANKVFVEDSKINMDKIVEHCETLCTFITTLDSLKIINVDEAYISDMLKSMKK